MVFGGCLGVLCRDVCGVLEGLGGKHGLMSLNKNVLIQVLLFSLYFSIGLFG